MNAFEGCCAEYVNMLSELLSISVCEEQLSVVCSYTNIMHFSAELLKKI